MALTSSITGYDPQWPRRYAEEAARLTPIFGAGLIGLHHVGSTAVPDLVAKPEIDILAVVGVAGVPETWSHMFAELGYRRGGDLSPGHRFFKRDVGGVRTHKVHICGPGHPSVADMLGFRDHLRRHPEDRSAYGQLKLRLERENTQGIGEYLSGKQPFIDALMLRRGRER
jgi:GrpB-like predicted nucleotidyltransferase (UPF0157 family)